MQFICVASGKCLIQMWCDSGSNADMEAPFVKTCKIKGRSQLTSCWFPFEIFRLKQYNNFCSLTIAMGMCIDGSWDNSWYHDSLWAEWSGHQILVRASFCPDQPIGPPSLLYNGCWISPGVKWLGNGADYPAPSSFKVVNELELFLCLLSVPAQVCHGMTFAFICVGIL